MNTPQPKIEYTKPEIVDYGRVQELTAGCHGHTGDFEGVNVALEHATSRGHCISTP
jgi:hypothetical protein